MIKYKIKNVRLQECLSDIKKRLGEVKIEHINKDGRNNLIIALRDRNHIEFILKIFLNKNNTSLKKIERETSFLKYVNKLGIKKIPKLLFFNEEKMYIMMSCLKGKKVYNPNSEDHKIYYQFIVDINKSKNEDFLIIPLASEACTSPEQLINIIDHRISLLKNKECELKDINNFINLEISSSWKKIKHFIENIKLDLVVEADQLFLSPSDVGFHNCIKNNKKLLFFDFEHSGKDDVAKIAIDFTLQPDSISKKKYTLLMLKKFCKIGRLNKKWLIRYKHYLPIYRIKWSLIMLNRLFNNLEYYPNDELTKYFNQIKNYHYDSEVLVQDSIEISEIILNSMSKDD